jgi:hypothetical protein
MGISSNVSLEYLVTVIILENNKKLNESLPELIFSSLLPAANFQTLKTYEICHLKQKYCPIYTNLPRILPVINEFDTVLVIVQNKLTTIGH